MKEHTPISVCVITKNECEKLKECLSCLKPYIDAGSHEIVVVDTGSTDNTIEMCKSFTENVYSFKWIDDFSAARNFAAEKATNNWILSIDSDEYITDWDEESLQEHIHSGDTLAGNLLLVNTCGFGEDQYLSNDYLSRLYNRTIYQYSGTIHEQLEPYDPSVGHPNKNIKLTAKHASYSSSAEELKEKAERNISMLKKEFEKAPHDPFILYQLGQSYLMLKDNQTANYYFDLGLAEDVDPNLSYVKSMVVSYGYTLINLKQYEKALALEGVYDTFGNRADFVFLMGLIYLNNGLIDEAIAQFQKATTFSFSVVDGANSYRAWYNLGVIYECTGHAETALEYYKKCRNYEPALARIQALKL